MPLSRWLSLEALATLHRTGPSLGRIWGVHRIHGLQDKSKAVNAYSKWSSCKWTHWWQRRWTKQLRQGKERSVQTLLEEWWQIQSSKRDKLALLTIMEQRTLLQKDNHYFASLPSHIMKAEENAKLDYKVAKSISIGLSLPLLTLIQSSWSIFDCLFSFLMMHVLSFSLAIVKICMKWVTSSVDPTLKKTCI